jgi:arylsulfatase B/arylsulfatase I/J
LEDSCLHATTILKIIITGPGRPNIVFILADDMGYNDIGYHNPGVHTPNLGNVFNK